ERDSERTQQILAEQGEEEQDRARDQHGADRHRATMGPGRAAGEAGEDRRAARRVDDQQEGDEGRGEERAHRPAGGTRPARICAATRVLRSSTAIVIGPTPPGTGVIAPATSTAEAKSTSPTSLVLPSPASIRLMPTSITVAPGFSQSPLTI